MPNRVSAIGPGGQPSLFINPGVFPARYTTRRTTTVAPPPPAP